MQMGKFILGKSKVLIRSIVNQGIPIFLVAVTLTGLFVLFRANITKNNIRIESSLSAHPYTPTPIPKEIKRFIHSEWVFSYTSLESIAKEADLIVLGTVSSVEKSRAVVDANGKVTVPYYNAKITLEAALSPEGLKKTDSQLKSVTLEVMGDPDDKTTLWEEVPIFKIGERYLLFLGKIDNSLLFETMSPQGRFQLIDGRVYPVTERNSWDRYWGQEESTFVQEVIQALRNK